MDRNSSRASEGRLALRISKLEAGVKIVRYVDPAPGTYRGDMRAAVCSGWPSLVSGLSSASLRRSRASVGVAESILKAALFVLVASTGEKLAARRTGRGAASTRLSSVALKLMSERARDERYLRVTSSGWTAEEVG